MQIGERYTTEVGDLLFSLQALLIREAEGGGVASTSSPVLAEPAPPAPVLEIATAPVAEVAEPEPVAAEVLSPLAEAPAPSPASVRVVAEPAVVAEPVVAPPPPGPEADPAFSPQVTVLPEAAPSPVRAREPEPVLFDPSTGAPNLNGLRKEIERQGSRVSAALVSLDISPLGEIRATDGDIAAEAVLRVIVEAVPFAMRSQDQVYRTGLDELTLCVPDAGLSDAAAMSLRLQLAVKDVLVRRELPPVILSIRPYQQSVAA